MLRFCSKQATRRLHGLRVESATRPRPRFRSCSIDITAYRLAVTEQLDVLAAAKGNGTFWKQKSPIDLDQADVHAVLSSSLVWVDAVKLKPMTMTEFYATIR